MQGNWQRYSVSDGARNQKEFGWKKRGESYVSHTAAISRKENRRLNDAYYTPSKLTEILLDHVQISGTILEPCSGDGAIAQHLIGSNNRVFTNEINPDLSVDFHLDAADWESWTLMNFEAEQIDWVVSNPPFNRAAEILPLAYEYCKTGIAFLLRLSWLEPTGNRGKWLKQHASNLSNVIIFSQPRPSFTDNKKVDSVTTAWLVWRKDNGDRGTKVDFIYEWNK